MARPLRILFEGAWYHVMNRGLERRAIFRSARDHGRFIDLLAEVSRRFGVEVHAFCLMGNHYHLLVRTPDPNLPEVMRHLDGVYTQKFNRAHGRDGPLLRGRYHGVLVQADRHLLCASRYIHLNPVEAGLVRDPADWTYSSFRAFLDPCDRPNWLRTATLLGMFGSVGARASYRDFVHAGVDERTRRFYETQRRGPVLGSHDFRNRIAEEHIEDASQPDTPEARLVRPRPSLPALERRVEVAFGLDAGALRVNGRSRGKGLAVARGAFVELAVSLGRYRMKDVRRWIGYRNSSSAGSARTRFRRAAPEGSSLRRTFLELVAAMEEDIVGEKCSEKT